MRQKSMISGGAVAAAVVRTAADADRNFDEQHDIWTKVVIKPELAKP